MSRTHAGIIIIAGAVALYVGFVISLLNPSCG